MDTWQKPVKKGISPDLVDALPQVIGRDNVIGEAQFGLRYLSSFLDSLPSGGRVLEIGSGPCLLLAHLSREYPELSFTGVEPMGPGFRHFADFLEAAKQRAKFALYEGGYETFHSDRKFDLIFLVNVLEHLPDWRDFLRFVRANMTDNGRCVVLCPNYGFPYESHFGIPIILTPSLTYFLFRKYIERFEERNCCQGLWTSLNFVKFQEVTSASRGYGLQVTFDTRITEEMITRLGDDPAFAKRQKLISVPARLAKKCGITKLLNLRALQRFHPYMFLEIRIASVAEMGDWGSPTRAARL